MISEKKLSKTKKNCRNVKLKILLSRIVPSLKFFTDKGIILIEIIRPKNSE